jgi:hypothetical protein
VSAAGKSRGLEREAEPRDGPRRGRAIAFALVGAPLAWFVQLDSDYALFAARCFSGPERRIALAEPSFWVRPAALLVYLLCLGVAAATIPVSLRIHRRALARDPEGKTGRDCFLGLCGLMIGIGFTATIAVSGLALLMVPACAL